MSFYSKNRGVLERKITIVNQMIVKRQKSIWKCILFLSIECIMKKCSIKWIALNYRIFSAKGVKTSFVEKIKCLYIGNIKRLEMVLVVSQNTLQSPKGCDQAAQISTQPWNKSKWHHSCKYAIVCCRSNNTSEFLSCSSISSTQFFRNCQRIQFRHFMWQVRLKSKTWPNEGNTVNRPNVVYNKM